MVLLVDFIYRSLPTWWFVVLHSWWFLRNLFHTSTLPLASPLGFAFPSLRTPVLGENPQLALGWYLLGFKLFERHAMYLHVLSLTLPSDSLLGMWGLSSPYFEWWYEVWKASRFAVLFLFSCHVPVHSSVSQYCLIFWIVLSQSCACCLFYFSFAFVAYVG